MPDCPPVCASVCLPAYVCVEYIYGCIACVHRHVCVCMYVCMSACLAGCMYLMYVCMYVRMYVSVKPSSRSSGCHISRVSKKSKNQDRLVYCNGGLSSTFLLSWICLGHATILLLQSLQHATFAADLPSGSCQPYPKGPKYPDSRM